MVGNEDIHQESNIHILFSGLKEELEELKGWISRSFGKYSPKELMERTTFNIMMIPPGYSRRQATFGINGRVNLIFASNCVFASIYIYIYMHIIYIHIHIYIYIYIYILKLI